VTRRVDGACNFCNFCRFAVRTQPFVKRGSSGDSWPAHEQQHEQQPEQKTDRRSRRSRIPKSPRQPASMQFRRPPDANPTPHLRVKRTGPPQPFSDEELATLRAAVTASGPYEEFVDGTSVFYSFEFSRHAAEAMKQLAGDAAAGSSECGDAAAAAAAAAAAPSHLPPIEVRYCIQRLEQVRANPFLLQ
jgi:hypothetical protein